MSIQIAEFESGRTHKTYFVGSGHPNILTTVTSDPSIVSLWISETEDIHSQALHSLIVGLSVDQRPIPTHHGGGGTPIATLQLCVSSRCLIYQIAQSDNVPYCLIDFLTNHSYTLVGVDIGITLNRLEKDYLFEFSAAKNNAVDVRAVALEKYQWWDLMAGEVTVEDLAEVVLGKQVERKPEWVAESDWGGRQLTEDQVKWACVDAFLCYEMGRVLKARQYRQ